MSTPEPELTKPRKRIRVLKSCLLCRQRKRKCDQKKPTCSYCNGKGLQCQYQETDRTIKVSGLENRGAKLDANNMNENTINSEILSISSRVKQLEAALINQQQQQKDKTTHNYAYQTPLPQSETPIGTSSSSEADLNPTGEPDSEVIDFHTDSFPNRSTTLPSHGLLSWVTLMRKDIYLCAFSVSLKFEKFQLFQKEKEAYFRQLKLRQQMRQNLVNDRSSSSVSDQLSKSPSRQQSQPIHNPLIAATGKEFIDRFEDEVYEFNTQLLQSQRKEATLLEMISSVLKDKKLMWMLIERFFNSELYCVLPILDKEEFKKDLLNILTPEEFGGKTELNIQKRQDVAFIGTLIMVMRLASCSLYNCGKPRSNLTCEQKYILDHPIGLGVMNVVNRCIAAIQNYKVPDIKILQLFLMKKCYSIYSPEDADCITNADPASLGLLLDHSFRCGINRDPMVSKDKSASANLIRRLWHQIVFMDQHQLMVVGCPSLIDLRYHDTHFPHLGESENPLELCINKSITERSEMLQRCHPLLMIILDVRRLPNVAEVNAKLKELQQLIDEQGKFDEIRKTEALTIESRMAKLIRFYRKVDYASLQFVIYHHFFLFYNQQNNKEMSVYYLLELIKKSRDFIAISKYFDQRYPDYNLANDFSTPLLLIPRIEHVIRRTLLVLFTICGRVNALIGFSTNLPSAISEITRTISDLCTKMSKRLVSRVENNGDAYYHSWVSSKVQAFIVKNLMERGYQNDSHVYQNFVAHLSTLKESDRIIFDYTLEDFNSILNGLRDLDSLDRADRSPVREHSQKVKNTKRTKFPDGTQPASDICRASAPTLDSSSSASASASASHDTFGSTALNNTTNSSTTPSSTTPGSTTQNLDEDHGLLSQADRVWLDQMLYGTTVSGLNNNGNSNGNLVDFDFPIDQSLNGNGFNSTQPQTASSSSIEEARFNLFMQSHDDDSLSLFASFV
ncbi:hypothetical protein WICPIJ_006487 [Wickerhamomyces pijperi]|uniref:Zn(2)-C6 fungal-type domain-containing protein n=1 Tax=Wickerhamomyces pijperi TaxID=599730 RepID=A0A9P8Q4B9_WICPI|nr:hypothetical protein WICPIJ_006487 [Wickerhamomyces pijperi]